MFVLFLLILLISCHNYRMIEGRLKPVYFTPKASAFNDTDFPNPMIRYNDFFYLKGNYSISVPLIPKETVIALINKPTFFNLYDQFLIYPKEHVTVSKSKYNDFTFEIENNEQRNKELLFLKTLDKIEKYPFLPFDKPLDTILAFEKTFKLILPKLLFNAKKTFDSLAIDYNVSKKFKLLTIGNIENKYSYKSLLNLYLVNKDTLLAYNLYQQKLKELLPYFNDIKNRKEFNQSILSLIDFVNELMPKQIWKTVTEKDFQTNYNIVNQYFNGLSRDYLLSHIMYIGNKNRIAISKEYITNYENNCVNKDYKNLIHKVFAEQRKNNKKAYSLDENNIILFKNKKISNLETLLERNKGKLLVLDFWASWCTPCLKEIPYLKKTIENYSSSNILFISISFDKDLLQWRKAVIANKLPVDFNYTFVNSEKSQFVKKYNIETIPRYIIIGKDGKFINDDAPSPSDAKLKMLLDNLLAN